MLIQCSSCGTQAKIPDSKEGAKVKCPSCGHVYVARAAGRGRAGSRSSNSNSTTPIVIGVAVAGALVIGLIAMRSGGTPEKPVDASERAEAKPKAEKKVWVDPQGFDGPAITFARSLHDAANAGNESRLLSLMDEERAYAAYLEEAPEGTADTAWAALGEVDRMKVREAIVAPLLARGDDAFVAGWKPFDAEYARGEGLVHVLRLRSGPADGGPGERWTEWTVADAGDGNWKWVDADRHLTDKEATALARGNAPRPEKKTLSDGQTVRESDPRAISYDPEVPADVRKQLDAAVATVFSDEATRKDRSAAEQRLLQAGPAAVAPLLTQMHAVAAGDPGDSERMRSILTVDRLLQDITEDVNNTLGMGATEEQIESGVKQWFAWYDRRYSRWKKKYDDAKDAPYVDPLEDMIDLESMSPGERKRYLDEKKRLEGGGR